MSDSRKAGVGAKLARVQRLNPHLVKPVGEWELFEVFSRADADKDRGADSLPDNSSGRFILRVEPSKRVGQTSSSSGMTRSGIGLPRNKRRHA